MIANWKVGVILSIFSLGALIVVLGVLLTHIYHQKANQVTTVWIKHSLNIDKDYLLYIVYEIKE